jgi:hypothetical protein
MQSEFCFIIPVKIGTPTQEFYIRRCLESIRRLYSNTLVVIALASGTDPLVFHDDNVIQVRNPYFSTIGCLYLMYVHRYAEYAYILHDSMVVSALLPKPTKDVSFIYTFHEPGMSVEHYRDNYRKILPPYDAFELERSQMYGCFGVSMGIRHSAIERLNILPLVSKITTKTDFCAMERVFAYLCRSQNIQHDVLCGSIFAETDPWAHPEFAHMTLDELLDRKYNVCVIKSLVGRTE